MSSFLSTLREQQAKNAGTEAGLEGFAATPFLTAEMEPITVPGIDPDPAATVAPDADVVVVVTPEDEAVDPDADIAEGDAVESLIACQASAETYGWSPALLDYMGRQGLLAGTAMETASFENYSMEADGAEVGGAVKEGIVSRAKAWAGKLVSKIGGLWDQVSAKFKKSQDEVNAATLDENAPVKETAIPYVKVAAIVAGIAAAAGAIYVAVKHVNFKALQEAGAIDKAAKAIDGSLTNVQKHIPWIRQGKTMTKTSQYFRNTLTWEQGAILPKLQSKFDPKLYTYFKNGAQVPAKQIGWTSSALSATRSGLEQAYKSVSGAVSGLYAAAKNPGAVVDGFMANPAAAGHAVGKGAVLAFVGSVVATVSWLLYHVVLKGAAVVAAAVRSVTGGRKKED